MVSVSGGDVFVARLQNETTADKIPLIFIHGGPGGTHGTPKKYLAPLADERPVYFYDQLGSYHSPAPFSDELMRVERFTEELHAILDAFGMSKAVLIGHSWGACIAIDYAIEHPDRMAGVILSSPLISSKRWIDDTNKLLAALPQDIQGTIKKHEADGTTSAPAYQAAANAFYKRHFCRLDPWPQDILDSFPKTNLDLYLSMWGPSEFACTGTLKDHDRFPDLHKISAPVLLTAGEYDEASPDTLREAATLIPDARVEVFPDASHTPYIESTALYLDSIDRFLKSLPA